MALLWRRWANGRRPGADPDATTIFFATDLHGSETCFRKFVAAAGFAPAARARQSHGDRVQQGALTGSIDPPDDVEPRRQVDIGRDIRPEVPNLESLDLHQKSTKPG